MPVSGDGVHLGPSDLPGPSPHTVPFCFSRNLLNSAFNFSRDDLEFCRSKSCTKSSVRIFSFCGIQIFVYIWRQTICSEFFTTCRFVFVGIFHTWRERVEQHNSNQRTLGQIARYVARGVSLYWPPVGKVWYWRAFALGHVKLADQIAWKTVVQPWSWKLGKTICMHVDVLHRFEYAKKFEGTFF